MKIGVFFKGLAQKVIYSLRRFPEAVLFAALTAAVGIYMNHHDMNMTTSLRDSFTRLGMAFALGVPLSLCVKVLFERLPGISILQRTAGYLTAAGALVLYYTFLLKDLDMVTHIRFAAVFMALFLAFAFIPYFFRKANYELYVVTLFIRFFITYLYSFVLYLGLAAILFTIDNLFVVQVPGEYYADIFMIVAGVFASGFFLAEIPEYGEELALESYSKILRVLLQFIVMPILTAYTIILYAYFVKIAVTRIWPEGLVSHLVLWYAFISALVIFFSYPLREKSKWTRYYIQIFPKAILPLLLMMFVSMGIRVNAYGITESRYYVILGGLWVFCGMVYLSIVKSPRNIVIPISMAIILLVSVFGPLSSYSVSERSQNGRLEKILLKNQMLSGHSIVKAKTEVSLEDRRQISAILSYFDNNHKLSDVKYLPKDFKMDQMESLLGFKSVYDSRDINNYFSQTMQEDGAFLDIKGYDFFMDFSEYKPIQMGNEKNNGSLTAAYTASNKTFKLMAGGKEVYSADLGDIARKLHEKQPAKTILTRDEMTFIDENQSITVRLVFKHLSGYADKGTGKTRMDSLDLYVFAKLK